MTAYNLPPPSILPGVSPELSKWLYELYKRDADLFDADTTLGDLADVGDGTPTSGNILLANGSTWESTVPLSIHISDMLDEDNLVSDSDTQVATQQSIRSASRLYSS